MYTNTKCADGGDVDGRAGWTPPFPPTELSPRYSETGERRQEGSPQNSWILDFLPRLLSGSSS